MIPVPDSYRTQYENIFIMPLNPNPTFTGSWAQGWYTFKNNYLSTYQNYSYIGAGAGNSFLDVAGSAVNIESSGVKMSSTKVDMLITPTNRLKFRNYNELSLNGSNQHVYRFNTNVNLQFIYGPNTSNAVNYFADRTFNSESDLWTFVSKYVRFMNVYYGTSWDDCDEMGIQTYVWTSVPAISGKNGILLPLSTLNDINNGEEVTTSDTSKFNLTGASNVAKLVSDIINV